MITQTTARARAQQLTRALMGLIAWLLLGPFILIGFCVGLVALVVRLVIAAMIEGFERGYHHA